MVHGAAGIMVHNASPCKIEDVSKPMQRKEEIQVVSEGDAMLDASSKQQGLPGTSSGRFTGARDCRGGGGNTFIYRVMYLRQTAV